MACDASESADRAAPFSGHGGCDLLDVAGVVDFRAAEGVAMNRVLVVRSQEEVDALVNRAVDVIDAAGTLYPGMSYEEGVIEAVRWLLGESNDNPMEN